jgi:hypothetical protein
MLPEQALSRQAPATAKEALASHLLVAQDRRAAAAHHRAAAAAKGHGAAAFVPRYVSKSELQRDNLVRHPSPPTPARVRRARRVRWAHAHSMRRRGASLALRAWAALAVRAWAPAGWRGQA